MAIIKTAIKVGVPSGVVYATFKQGFWTSPENESFKRSVDLIDQTSSDAEQLVKPYVEPLVASVKLPDIGWLKKADPVCWWNCGVRMTCRAIVDFEPISTMDKIMDKMNSYTKPAPPTPATKTSQ